MTLMPEATAAQDILQDTAIAIWEKFDEYDENESFVPWALKFAYYKVLSFRKAEQKHRHLDQDVLEQITKEFPNSELLHAQRSALTECLGRLNKNDRKLVEYRYERQEPVAKLAKAMECSANVLYKALGRIRRALMECINQRMEREGRT